MSDIEYHKSGITHRVPQGIVQHTTAGDLYVRDSGGRGRAVLLIHGWGADSLITWAGAIPALRERWRVIAIDLPGHGHSPGAGAFGISRCADGIAEVLETRDIERTLVCGYSLGGAVMLQLAHRHRTRVGGVIPVATGARLVSFGAGSIQAAGNLLRNSWGRGMNDPTEEMRIGHAQHVMRSIVRHDAKVLGDALREAAAFDGRTIAENLHIPSSIIITKLDVVVRPALQRELAELLGATRVEVGFGHDYCTKRHFSETLTMAIDGVERGLIDADGFPGGSEQRV